MDAAKFLSTHNEFYADMQVNEERAKEAFEESGCTSAAVLQQAVPIEISAEQMKMRLSGPADTGDAGLCQPCDEQMVAIDGEAVQEDLTSLK